MRNLYSPVKRRRTGFSGTAGSVIGFPLPTARPSRTPAPAVAAADQALSLNRTRNDELEIANSLRLLGEPRTRTGLISAQRRCWTDRSPS